MKSLTPLTPERRDTMKRNLVILACLMLAVSPIGVFGQRESPPLSDAVRLAVLENSFQRAEIAAAKQEILFDQRLKDLVAQVAENRATLLLAAGRSGGISAAKDTVSLINQNVLGFLAIIIAGAALFVGMRRNKIALEGKDKKP